MQWADRIGHRLKLRDLHVLIAVVQSGSMTKAAESLAISVPVVSKAISDLEHALGVRLLDRSARGVEPTPYGRALLESGLAAFDELRQGVKTIQFLADPTAGEVRIGCPVTMATGFVSVVSDRLSRKYPHIVVHLVAAESAATYRALEERKVDLAIVGMYGPLDDAHLNAEVLFHEPFVIAAGRQSRWARRRSVKLAELINERWTLPPSDTLFGSVVVEAFRASGLDVPRATVVTSSVPARNRLVETGRFLTALPRSMLKFYPKNATIRILPIDLPTTRRPIGIITLKNRSLSPVAQRFVACARELARRPAHRDSLA
jgi:DNA-binding transcriptional LysR family regulator